MNHPLFHLHLYLVIITTATAQLTTTFTSASTEKSVTTYSPLPALQVIPGEPPAPGLSPGPFTAHFKAELIIPKRYRIHFSVESLGTVTLNINGTPLSLHQGKSERLRLNPGTVPIHITYTSPPNGVGHFRLFWEERRAFPREPIPASAFTHITQKNLISPSDPSHLFASHNCIHCHHTPLGKNAMPELLDQGPDLSNIGDRHKQAWLTRWIAQPDLLKPSTTMPAMVDHRTPQGAQKAADIASYLATLTTHSITSPPPDYSLVEDGGDHFHKLGCIACHTMPDAPEPDFTQQRIPLNNIAAKFKNTALVAYLKNPQANHPSAKMPNFRLSNTEAHSLAAYLTKTSTGQHTPDPSEFPPGDPIEGKKLITDLNCASCHEGLPTVDDYPKAPPLNGLTSWHHKGCLGPEEKRGKAPRLNLSTDEKKSLTPALLPALQYDTLEAFTQRQIHSLRCTACHSQHHTPSLLSKTHPETISLKRHPSTNDQGLIQSRPPLTHIGAMLHSDYLVQTFLGTLPERPRPWLEMRMPSFPHHATLLAHGIGQLHGLLPSSASTAEAPSPQVELGRTLTSTTGYACTTCHAVGEQPALAAFEVQGINFSLSHQRLRPDYFHQWMFHPARLIPDSKMPRYTNPEDGSALRQDILNGDSQKQFEAIRLFIQSVKKN